MYTWAPTSSVIGKRWLYFLHLFYAGLFAFVLPLICWGAQATPGHPHARAHFVFANPPMHAHDDRTIAGTITDVNQWLTEFGRTTLCTTHIDKTPLPAAEPTQVPTGRSVPAQMGATLLTLIGLAAFTQPMNADGPGRQCWLAPPSATFVTTLIPTPPPRA